MHQKAITKYGNRFPLNPLLLRDKYYTEIGHKRECPYSYRMALK